MRIALFSDVHGNLSALEAILTELERLGPFDATVCAGDLVFLGPSPGEVVERLKESDIVCLRGNCEGIVTGQILPDAPPIPDIKKALTAHKDWTVAQLTSEQLHWLGELPIQYRISPTGGNSISTNSVGYAGDGSGGNDVDESGIGHDAANDGADGSADLLVTHATPRSFHDAPALCAPDLSEKEARQVFGTAGVGTVAFGHRHGHFISSYGNLTLVNVSSASITPDGLAAAGYTVATWRGDHWTFEQNRVTYDLQPEFDRARTRSFPAHPWWAHVGLEV